MHGRRLPRRAATAVRTRWQIIESILVPNEASSQQRLRIAAWVMIGAGIGCGVASTAFTFIRYMAFDVWWFASVLVLLFAFRAEPVRRFSRAAGLLMALIWFLWNMEDLSYISHYVISIEDYFLGAMLILLGVIVLLTNDPHQQSRSVLRRCSSALASHRMKVIAVCIAMLWIANPNNSHSMCLTAADVFERRGEYDSALICTRLARDKFPLGYHGHHHEMAVRIRRLNRQKHAQSIGTWPEGALGGTGDDVPTVIARRGPSATPPP